MRVGAKRLYNRGFKDQDVILWDVFPVTDGEVIKVVFESKNSEWSQGMWLMCDQGVEIEGEIYKSVYLWYESSPTQVEVVCHTRSGLLNIYNVWDRGMGPNSQAETSGMLVEEIPNGRRYRCHDIGFESTFNKLVFRIERLELEFGQINR